MIYCPVTTCSHPCDLLSSQWSTVQWPPALIPVIYCPVTTLLSPLWSTVQWPPALTPVIYCPVTTCSHPCDLLSSLTPVIFCPVTTCSHPCDLLSSDHLLSLPVIYCPVVTWTLDLLWSVRALSCDHWTVSSLWSTVQWPPALIPVIYCPVTTCSHPCDLLSSLTPVIYCPVSLDCDLLSSDHLLSSLWSTVQWPPALIPVIYCPVVTLDYCRSLYWGVSSLTPVIYCESLTPVIYCPVSLDCDLLSSDQVLTPCDLLSSDHLLSPLWSTDLTPCDLLSSDHLLSSLWSTVQLSSLWSTVQWPPALIPVIYCPVTHPCDLLSSLTPVIYCPVDHPCDLLSRWSTGQSCSHPCDLLSSDHLLSPLWSTVQSHSLWSTV